MRRARPSPNVQRRNSSYKRTRRIGTSSKTQAQEQQHRTYEFLLDELISDGKPLNSYQGRLLLGWPSNVVTGTMYMGSLNVYSLRKHYAALCAPNSGLSVTVGPRYLTFRQAKARNVYVKRGEHGASIRYCTFKTTTPPSNNNATSNEADDFMAHLQSMRTQWSTVFHLEQCAGAGMLALITAAKETDSLCREGGRKALFTLGDTAEDALPTLQELCARTLRTTVFDADSKRALMSYPPGVTNRLWPIVDDEACVNFVNTFFSTSHEIALEPNSPLITTTAVTSETPSLYAMFLPRSLQTSPLDVTNRGQQVKLNHVQTTECGYCMSDCMIRLPVKESYLNAFEYYSDLFYCMADAALSHGLSPLASKDDVRADLSQTAHSCRKQLACEILSARLCASLGIFHRSRHGDTLWHDREACLNAMPGALIEADALHKLWWRTDYILDS